MASKSSLAYIILLYDNQQKHLLLPFLGRGQISTRTYGYKYT